MNILLVTSIAYYQASRRTCQYVLGYRGSYLVLFVMLCLDATLLVVKDICTCYFFVKHYHLIQMFLVI